jgi:hypothetical protein
MASRNLPHHLYVHVDSSFIRKDGHGFEPAVWFALRSEPNRAWGCHIILECGAVYRNVPPMALAFSNDPEPDWTLQQAQCWDCYGTAFDTIKYTYLSDLTARYDGTEDRATCLFAACPSGDGFSMAPEQSKEFLVLRTTGDRLLIRPTNMVLFEERSFTEDTGWPTDIMTATQVWNCE